MSNPIQRTVHVVIAAALAYAAPGAAQTVRVEPATPITAGAPGRPFVEPHLAVDPRDAAHLLIGVAYSVPAAEFRDVVAGRTCLALDSRDGGATWTTTELPGTGCLDPWVAFTGGGHAVFAALPTLPNTFLVHHSPDGGRTWDPLPADLGRGHDHPTLVADGSAAVRAGWVYAVTSRNIRGEEGKLRFVVEIARSRDHGRTFDPAARIAPSNLLIKAETPAVLADGTVIVSHVDVARNNQQPRGGADLAARLAWVSASADGGHTFATPRFATDACGSSPAFSLSALAADTSAGPFRDRLYFACERPGGRGVAVTASGDRGETWPDTVVTLAASRDTTVTRRYQPALAVNGRGALLAAWVEVEGAVRPRGAAWGHCLALYVAASTDGARTFSAPARVSRSCPDARANGANSPAGGDYFGLSAAPDGRFRLVWPDARNSAFRLWTTAVEVGR